MSTLDADRPLEPALRSFARHTLRRCVDRLREADPVTATAAPTANDVHQVRKGIKQLRAWLRLVRPSLGDHYALLDLLLADAARALAAVRDAQVSRETLLRLRRQHLIDAPTYAALRKALPQVTEPGADAVIAARRRLQVAALYVDSAALPESPAELLKRWKRQLARCERLADRLHRRLHKHADAARHGDAHALHRWRRQLKYLLHQSQLLAPLHPAAGDLEPALKRLADQLGEHHDLYVLNEHFMSAAMADSECTQATRVRLNEAIAQQMEQLANEALNAGRTLFTDD